MARMNEEELMVTLNLIAEQCPEALEGNGTDIQINTKKLDSNCCE